MTIKEFCEKYNNIANQKLKDDFIKSNIKITPYVPFVKKDALISNLLKATMIDKETGNVKVNSSAEYLLKTRILIENYTNLMVETDGFYEEYDELKKSGLFTILLIGDDNTAPLIPIEEIAEFNHLLSIKRNDVLTNRYEIHSFITEQVDRFKALGEATLAPFMEAVSKKLDEIPKEDLEGKILEFAKNGNFKEV
jgi:hypothetical protein